MATPSSTPFFNPSGHTYVTSKSKSTTISDSFSSPSPIVTATQFHREILPGYSPTRLIELPQKEVDGFVRKSSNNDDHNNEKKGPRVFVKEESQRYGLPAFKMLGASWAVYLSVCETLGIDLAVEKPNIEDLKSRLSLSKSTTFLLPHLFAATEGNHGRAVGRMGKLLDLKTTIFVSKSVREQSREFIRSEGAELIVIEGDYDEAMRMAWEESKKIREGVLIQDTAWDGYEDIPEKIVAGYETLFVEIDEQLSSSGIQSPTLVVVPVGVGSLAHSAVKHYRQPKSSSSSSSSSSSQPRLCTVEPTSAPCFLTSLHHGKPTTIQTNETIMAGLHCATLSTTPWNDMFQGVDISVAVEDEEVIEVMRKMKAWQVDSGPCGSAGLAGIRKLLSMDEAGKEWEERVGWKEGGMVVFLSSEGRSKGYPV